MANHKVEVLAQAEMHCTLGSGKHVRIVKTLEQAYTDRYCAEGQWIPDGGAREAQVAHVEGIGEIKGVWLTGNKMSNDTKGFLLGDVAMSEYARYVARYEQCPAVNARATAVADTARVHAEYRAYERDVQRAL